MQLCQYALVDFFLVDLSGPRNIIQDYKSKAWIDKIMKK